MSNDEKTPRERPTPAGGSLKPPPPTRAPTGRTIPPGQRYISVLAHTALDLVAILVVAAFVLSDKLDATLGLGVITAIAGVWIANQVRRGGGPPITGTLLGMGHVAAEVIRRVKGLG